MVRSLDSGRAGGCGVGAFEVGSGLMDDEGLEVAGSDFMGACGGGFCEARCAADVGVKLWM
jgi:hypothetical protein